MSPRASRVWYVTSTNAGLPRRGSKVPSSSPQHGFAAVTEHCESGIDSHVTSDGAQPVSRSTHAWCASRVSVAARTGCTRSLADTTLVPEAESVLRSNLTNARYSGACPTILPTCRIDVSCENVGAPAST